MKTITICSSATFYEHVNEIAEQLEKHGYTVLVPDSAKKMRDSGNYDVAAHKTWYNNEDDFHIKQALMDAHFAKVAQADAVLMVNDEKHGQPGYIGPNGLMELAIGYYLKKPIYILNDVGPEAPLYEEIRGMDTKIISGDLTAIKL